MKFKSKIVAAFPGTGKSTYFRENERCLDSDSSNFSWIVDENGIKTRNPEFPLNYIEHIKENMINDEIDWIFISSHKEVRDLLIENEIPYYLVFPNVELKEEYLYRYIMRGSPQSFVDLLDSKWEEWLGECEELESEFVRKIELGKDTTMEKAITSILNYQSDLLRK